MGSDYDGHDLVLEAVTPTVLGFARQLLGEAGIPSIAHGLDFGGLTEMDSVGELMLRRQSLYVPRGQGERAREVLREAWGDAAEPFRGEERG